MAVSFHELPSFPHVWQSFKVLQEAEDSRGRSEKWFCNIIEVAWERETDLAWVVVPQLVVQAVGVSFLSLDLGDDIKNLWLRAAGAGASFCVWFTLWVTAAVVWNQKRQTVVNHETRQRARDRAGAGRVVMLPCSAAPSRSIKQHDVCQNAFKQRNNYPHNAGDAEKFQLQFLKLKYIWNEQDSVEGSLPNEVLATPTPRNKNHQRQNDE